MTAILRTSYRCDECGNVRRRRASWIWTRLRGHVDLCERCVSQGQPERLLAEARASWATKVRNAIALALLFAAVFWQPWRADADTRRWTVEDTHAALAGASGRAACIVRVETGATYNPYATGDRGTSLGVAQLHSPGLRDVFEQDGWGDVWSPYDSVAFLEWALAHGYAEAWTPVRMGLC